MHCNFKDVLGSICVAHISLKDSLTVIAINVIVICVVYHSRRFQTHYLWKWICSCHKVFLSGEDFLLHWSRHLGQILVMCWTVWTPLYFNAWWQNWMITVFCLTLGHIPYGVNHPDNFQPGPLASLLHTFLCLLISYLHNVMFYVPWVPLTPFLSP
jgi:hypothetical protein